MAKMWITEHGTKRTLYIEAYNNDEIEPLENFCRPGQNVPAIVRWDKGYQLPRIEIRRKL